MRYKLQMMDTDFGVGMFAAIPEQNLSYNEMADYLRSHPYDDYMHEFVLQRFKDFRTRKLKKLIQEVMKDNGTSDPVMTAILYEACLCHERQRPLLNLFKDIDPLSFIPYTPAIHIQSNALPDQPLHRQWTDLFGQNIFALSPLPSPTECELETPVNTQDTPLQPAKSVAEIRHDLEDKLPPAKERRPLMETSKCALEALKAADAFLGPPMDHKASLSPVARLRHWMTQTRTVNGSLSNSLEGIQTSYGRGLIEASANASYSMEMAERFSSYASVSTKGITGYIKDYPLTFARYSDLTEDAVNPNEVRLEVPYADQKLNWFEGHTPDGTGGYTSIWIPAQFVFLFCNLDEQSLFSALGSTGLASGNTLEEAKVAALCEVIERDCDATVLYDPKRCFRIETDDPEIAQLLQNYEDDGISVWFMDITSEFGIPCYKSVVLGQHGDVNKGGGCGLNGKSALISAMTETAYPYPGPTSQPAPEGLPVRKLEDLPDHSTGSAEGDLMVLETTLMANGLRPAYADMTRKDLQIPVTRAIVPGLEIISDFDHYSRISPRLFNNYLQMFD